MAHLRRLFDVLTKTRCRDCLIFNKQTTCGGGVQCVKPEQLAIMLLYRRSL